MSTHLAAIRQRDAESAETWFRKPNNATARAIQDRRWLLAALDRYQDLELQARHWRNVVSPDAGHPKVLNLVAAIDRLPADDNFFADEP